MTQVGQNITLNTFHQDKWQVVFSNIPSLTNMVEMNLYNLFIKGVSIPEYTQEYIPSNFKGSQIWNPISQNNDQLNTFEVEFKLSENMENYYNLFHWMQTIRYGLPNTEAVRSTLIRKNTVKAINLLFLDNQKRVKKKMILTEAVLVGLSNLPLQMGSSEEITFTTTWQYQETFLEDP